jgi:8-oxo-dGTP pyrophosphatase MutT (NUDIX family)
MSATGNDRAAPLPGHCRGDCVATGGITELTRDQIVGRIAAAQRVVGRRWAPGTAISGMLGEPALNGVAAPRRGDHDLNDAGMRPAPPLRAAAILVPLVERPAGVTVLLTQRSPDLRHHAGQISFPGGRAEPQDKSAQATALREAYEEIGLPRERVDLIGTLDIYETRTGFEIVPVVGLVSPPLELEPDLREVAEIFEVPLSFILDPANHERHTRVFEGVRRQFYAMPFGERYIWGATAGMLVNLYEVLTAPGEA